MIHFRDEHAGQKEEELPSGVAVCEPHDTNDGKEPKSGLQTGSAEDDKEQV